MTPRSFIGFPLLQRTFLLVGTIAFSVLTTTVAERLANPAPPAAAQVAQPAVVRGSAFELVGEDGSVLARLTAGGLGNGNLTLFDTTGNRRVSLGGNGTLAMFDTDGSTLRFLAGYSLAPGATGAPPVNGVRLAPDGTVGMLAGCSGPVVC